MTPAEQSAMFARSRAERRPRRDAEMARALAAVSLHGDAGQRPPLPAGYVDIVCHSHDEVHRVEVGDSEIPFAICPHDGGREYSFLDAWSENARTGYAEFKRLLASRYREPRPLAAVSENQPGAAAGTGSSSTFV